MTTGGLQAQLLALQSILTQIRCEIQELRTNQMADRVSISKNFTLVNANIRRIAVQPGVRSFRGTLAGGNDDARNLQAASAADQPVVAIVRSQPSLSPTQKIFMRCGKNMKSELVAEKRPNCFLDQSGEARTNINSAGET